MNKNKSKSNTIPIAIILILAIAAIIGFATHDFTPPAEGNLLGISDITYKSDTGEVRDGQLYGAKISLLLSLTDDIEKVVVELTDDATIWNKYKITPKKNLRIDSSAHHKAESSTAEYRRNYYDPTWEPTKQTLERTGTPSWDVLSSVNIKIYADEKDTPTTPLLEKTLTNVDLTGNQIYDIGQGINFQKAFSAQSGIQTLPDPQQVVIATAPSFKDFEAKALNDYSSPKTYIFDKSTYETKVNWFYENLGKKTFARLNDPLLSLWTGYDKYESAGFGACSGLTGYAISGGKGYCNLNWDGLYKVPQANIGNLRYSSEKLTIDPIQYSLVGNLELPSETVESIAILRGVGNIDITRFDMAESIRQPDQKPLYITVKNTGDDDGYNIVPNSPDGKIIFSPTSYTNQLIKSGEEQTFKFVFSVAGKETSETVSTETISVTISANHNEKKVTKTKTLSLEYETKSETEPDGVEPEPGDGNVDPTTGDTMQTGNGDEETTDGTVVNWYETTGFYLLIVLSIILVILLLWRRNL